MKNTLHLVSCSGGKDSTATLLLALKQFPMWASAAYADTGNEHEATYEYLEYLEAELGIEIKRLRADFTEQFETKRRNLTRIADGEPESAVYGAREFKYSWTAAAAKSALDVLHPTGVPFLDICMLRGGFPSRKRQFCTEELKTKPLTEYQLDLVESSGCDLWSWQGVRRDESAARSNAKGFEEVGGGIFAFRPIAGWTAQQTVDFVRSCGLKLNPLYEQGMARVGCMPCINASKNELAEIARRFPEHVHRISEWERLLLTVSRPASPVSFFHIATAGHSTAAGTPISRAVAWANTKRGGKEADPKWLEDAPACASSYGLCE